MNNQEWDNLLNIQTTNERDWQSSIFDYYRLESTDYSVLQLLIDNLSIEKNEHFVDMGCGTGRALFFMHYKVGIHVTGIELHPMTFDELETNNRQYQDRFKNNDEEITLVHNYADQYEIQDHDTIFYFFNPFAFPIFKAIISNILESYSKSPRKITLLLYYPERKVIDYLHRKTEFESIKKIKIPGNRDSRESIHIFVL